MFAECEFIFVENFRPICTFFGQETPEIVCSGFSKIRPLKIVAFGVYWRPTHYQPSRWGGIILDAVLTTALNSSWSKRLAYLAPLGTLWQLFDRFVQQCIRPCWPDVSTFLLPEKIDSCILCNSAVFIFLLAWNSMQLPQSVLFLCLNWTW